MKPHNWYYGRITRADAEKLLANKHEGKDFRSLNTAVIPIILKLNKNVFDLNEISIIPIILQALLWSA